MKINITGNVIGPEGKLSGIIDMPEEEAERLLSLHCAEIVVEDAPSQDQEGTELNTEESQKQQTKKKNK